MPCGRGAVGAQLDECCERAMRVQRWQQNVKARWSRPALISQQSNSSLYYWPANATLQYVTASTAPDSTTSTTLTWNNVGPLAAGQSVDLYVTFKGLASANPAVNSVTVTPSTGPYSERCGASVN